MPLDPLVLQNPQTRVVDTFEALVGFRFENGVNAVCWPRDLEGDFAEVVSCLHVPQGITHLTEELLHSLDLSPAGQKAVEVMLADMERLRERELLPTLDCVNGYTHEIESPVRTDVCSFHADSATVQADTWLCTYHGASSEGLRNDEVICRVDVPETREELRQLHAQEDDMPFEEWLEEHFYTLHYAPQPGAVPFRFGRGNLWRIALQYPDSPVLPCIHRAPDPMPGEKRLLLIS
ncbi:MAG: hypothetical protein U1F81_01745 [Verrucomicrobiaceae bacterium]